jgi:hypothetical protein
LPAAGRETRTLCKATEDKGMSTMTRRFCAWGRYQKPAAALPGPRLTAQSGTIVQNNTIIISRPEPEFNPLLEPERDRKWDSPGRRPNNGV